MRVFVKVESMSRMMLVSFFCFIRLLIECLSICLKVLGGVNEIFIKDEVFD